MKNVVEWMRCGDCGNLDWRDSEHTRCASRTGNLWNEIMPLGCNGIMQPVQVTSPAEYQWRLEALRLLAVASADVDADDLYEPDVEWEALEILTHARWYIVNRLIYYYNDPTYYDPLPPSPPAGVFLRRRPTEDPSTWLETLSQVKSG